MTDLDLLSFARAAISSLQKIGRILLNGGVIAVPTDTVYGLACCGLNTQALQRLYEIKGRDAAKPMAICLDKASSIPHWCNTSHINDNLLATLLPGPVTVILPRRQPLDPLSPLLNPEVAEIGIRVPDHPVVRQIPEALASAFRDCPKDCLAGLHIPDGAAVAEATALPIVLTSANPSGLRSTLAPEEFQSLWPQLDLIIDGGRIIADEGADVDSGNQNASRAGSTVVNLSECVRSPGSNLYTIVREGSALIQTEKILARFGLRRSTPA